MSRHFIFISNRVSPVLTSLTMELKDFFTAFLLISRKSNPLFGVEACADLLSSNGIPLFVISEQHLRSESFLSFLRSLNPDFIVVHSLHFLLPQTILDIPKHCCMNLHPSLLPAYRGPNPWFWQYFDGVKTGGFTVHKMTKKEDAGDILAQQDFEIDYNMKQCVFSEKVLAEIGAPLLCKTILTYEKITSIPQPQTPMNRRARNIIDYRNDIEILDMSLHQREILNRVYPGLL